MIPRPALIRHRSKKLTNYSTNFTRGMKPLGRGKLWLSLEGLRTTWETLKRKGSCTPRIALMPRSSELLRNKITGDPGKLARSHASNNYKEDVRHPWKCFRQTVDSKISWSRPSGLKMLERSSIKTSYNNSASTMRKRWWSRRSKNTEPNRNSLQLSPKEDGWKPTRASNFMIGPTRLFLLRRPPSSNRGS